jgi:predicted aconitase
MPGVIAECAIGLLGALLVGVALFANQRWLDRHFLPSFFVTRPVYIRLETLVRVGLGLLGIILALIARPRIGRFVARGPARAMHVALAAALAVAASEVALRHVELRSRTVRSTHASDGRSYRHALPTARSAAASSSTRSTRPDTVFVGSTKPSIHSGERFFSPVSR